LTPGAPLSPAEADLTLGSGQVDVWVIALEHPDKRRRRELAHLAQDRVLAAYLGLTPARLEFERGPGGKPRLRGEPLQYNLSHSERVALVAVTATLPVGVDVQAPHPTTHRPWFARRICTPREYDHFRAAPQPEELLRLWTRKEAVLKARGEGSYVAVSDIDVLEGRVEGGWSCLDLTVSVAGADGYCAALAVRSVEPPSLALRHFSWS
jgi:4'-phosphopantetheinyl transferase